MPIPVWDVLSTTRTETKDKRSFYLMWYDRVNFKGSRDDVIAQIKELVRTGTMAGTRANTLIDSLRGK